MDSFLFGEDRMDPLPPYGHWRGWPVIRYCLGPSLIK